MLNLKTEYTSKLFQPNIEDHLVLRYIINVNDKFDKNVKLTV